MLRFTFVDEWLIGSCAYLQEKYKEQRYAGKTINPLEYLEFQVTEKLITINAKDDTDVGSWLANELWMRRNSLIESGFGLKVLVGGKVVADLPSPEAPNRRDTMLSTISNILQTTESSWLKRQSRGVYPNLQRVRSLQQNDGTVYIVSAYEGGNNIIKAVFPYLGLEDVLATKSSQDLVNKPVSYATGVRNPGDDDPLKVGRIRATVVREGEAEGHYVENYPFIFGGIKQELQAEYLSLDSEDKEAIVIVRNLDLIQRGTWIQRRQLLG